MTPPFTPLSGRVLLEPVEPDRTTDSGLVLVEDRKPETMGRVVAVAEPADSALVAEIRRVIASELVDACDPELLNMCDEVLNILPQPVDGVKVGDLVLFSWVSGQEILLDDARYLIMPEADLLAVVEE